MPDELPKIGDNYHGHRIVKISPYTGLYPNLFSCVVRMTAHTESGYIEIAWGRNTIKTIDGEWF